jgi:hypothetical protein
MTVQSFSGADFSAFIIVDHYGRAGFEGRRKPFKLTADLHTITISSTASIGPVRALGKRKVIDYTRGARTFAGTMIFTVADKDPFQELFSFDALMSAQATDGIWHIDMMPKFDIMLSAVNEGGLAGVQLVQGITLTNTGTTYSVDDMYTENTYTYVADYVSPFVKNPTKEGMIRLSRRHLQVNKVVDDILSNIPALLNKYKPSDFGKQLLDAFGSQVNPDSIHSPVEGVTSSVFQDMTPGVLKLIPGWQFLTDPLVLAGLYSTSKKMADDQLISDIDRKLYGKGLYSTFDGE